MKLIRRRTAADEELWDQPLEQEPEQDDEDDVDETGWQTSTAHLSGIARLTRIGAWALIASGPLLGLASLLGSSSPATSAPVAEQAAQQASDTGPSGFAQLYLTAYLAAGQGTESTLAPYFAGTVALSNQPGARYAGQMVTVASREVQPGYWSVTVAADVREKNSQGSWADTGLQYFRVAVQVLGPSFAGGSGGATAPAFIATSLPAQVAAPAALTASALGYGTDRGSNASAPETQTTSSFLSAYLAGQGGLSYYTSPGVTLQPVSPAPYTSVQVTDISDDSANSGSTSVPADGTVRQVLAQVTATDAAGNSYPLTYSLTLRARGGRWEIAALGDAPALQVGSVPTTPTPSPDPGGASSTGSPSGVPSPSSS